MGLKVRLFGGVQKGSKFGFGGQTWVQVSLKFDLSSLKWFEVHYIWVRSNTTCYKKNLKFDLPSISYVLSRQLKVNLQITFVLMEINYAAIITIREGITNSGWGRIFSKDLKKG